MESAVKGHILIVDDEISICTGISGLLELDGFKTDFAHGEKDCLAYLDKNPDVDIILLDVNLGPGLDGLQLLPLIKSRYKYVQVVMFTSHDSLSIGIESMKKGAFDFLTKPFNELQFLKIADAAIERKKLIQIKDLYFDMVVHDLKNPLQCISGALEILREMYTEQNTIQKRLFETAENGVKQIFSMVSNMLGVTSFEKGTIVARKSQVDFKSTVLNELKMFSLIHISFSDSVPDKAYIDKDLFFRVVSNITGNAIRFSIPDSIVNISFDCHDDQLEISVKNTGSFIPEDMREVVFDKFSGVQKSMNSIKGQNFGLGLTFSKMAVNAMNGKIWVEGDSSVPETVFKFTVDCSSHEDTECYAR
ncbi:MAG: hybrid sensor histidine kinase/response regulator [Chitinispirillaceae bacterium]|nr:hybrid sensor histidine kinase/response regulator [Chitinispirillaceae bacterium]